MPKLTKKMEDTMRLVRPVLTELGARSLWQAPASNGSFIDAQVIGLNIVLFHYYKDGGVQHYVPGHGGTFEAMATQLHQLAAS